LLQAIYIIIDQNMKQIAPLIILPAVLFLAGCAQKPEAIQPAYISHLAYMDYTCEQLASEQTRLVHALSTSSDAILLGLPVSSLSGSNQASNIARLKGELEALQKAMVLKDCGTERVPIDDIIKKKK